MAYRALSLTGVTCFFYLRVSKGKYFLLPLLNFPLSSVVIGQKLVQTCLHLSLSLCQPDTLLALLVCYPDHRASPLPVSLFLHRLLWSIDWFSSLVYFLKEVKGQTMLISPVVTYHISNIIYLMSFVNSLYVVHLKAVQCNASTKYISISCYV